MKTKLVIVPSVRTLIKPSPGFAKKKLAESKIDLLALCEFACAYCSSNMGYYQRLRREQFADLAQAQLGERAYPDTNPELAMHFPQVIAQLRDELAGKGEGFGFGQTLMFSMLTDAFSPTLVKNGTTRAALDLLLERTSFRIRVLTKNSTIGSDDWVRFFEDNRARFIVGTSTGTQDDLWARRVELGTSQPSSRLRALRRLQDAGVPTYGMLCPVFPDVLQGQNLEDLVDSVRPELCEQIWAEPFNDRVNWRAVRDGYNASSSGYRWMTEAFEQRNPEVWSAYALELFQRLRNKASSEGWLNKLVYLLYEGRIIAEHVGGFGDLTGVLLQGNTEDGWSRNPAFAEVQQRLAKRTDPGGNLR